MNNRFMLVKNGKAFSRFAIKSILQNPVYMIADGDAWEYFKEFEIYSEKEKFDGKHGLMVYNKTLQRSGKTNITKDINEWIIAVGKHDGIISGADWVKAQSCFFYNF